MASPIDIYNPQELQQNKGAHTVTITSVGKKGVTRISSYLPEEISLSTESDWSAPFSDVGGGGTLSTLLANAGISLKTKPLSAQIWQGTSPLELSIPLLFLALEDPIKEVMAPLVKLLQMVVPDVVGQGQQFVPPGPTLLQYLKQHANESVARYFSDKIPDTDRQNQGEMITIRLGRFMKFKNCIISAVAPRINAQSLYSGAIQTNAYGYPVRVTVDVTFRMYTASDKKEIDDIFKMPKVVSQGG